MYINKTHTNQKRHQHTHDTQHTETHTRREEIRVPTCSPPLPTRAEPSPAGTVSRQRQQSTARCHAGMWEGGKMKNETKDGKKRQQFGSNRGGIIHTRHKQFEESRKEGVKPRNPAWQEGKKTTNRHVTCESTHECCAKQKSSRTERRFLAAGCSLYCRETAST